MCHTPRGAHGGRSSPTTGAFCSEAVAKRRTEDGMQREDPRLRGAPNKRRRGSLYGRRFLKSSDPGQNRAADSEKKLDRIFEWLQEMEPFTFKERKEDRE